MKRYLVPGITAVVFTAVLTGCSGNQNMGGTGASSNERGIAGSNGSQPGGKLENRGNDGPGNGGDVAPQTTDSARGR